MGSCALRFVAAREHCCPCEWGSRRRALEGGAEQVTAAVAKIGQHQRNVVAQGEIPVQGKAHYNVLLLKDLRRGKKNLGYKLTLIEADFNICDCPIPDLNSFSFCWGWDTPLLQAVRACAAMVKACVG